MFHIHIRVDLHGYTHTQTNVCVHMNAHMTTFFFVSFPITNAIAN